MPSPSMRHDPSHIKEADEHGSGDLSFSEKHQELFRSIWNMHFEEIRRRCRNKLCCADRQTHYEEDLANDVMLGIWRELTSSSHQSFESMEDIWIAILRLIEERAIDRVKYLYRKRRRCPFPVESLLDCSAASRDPEYAVLLQLEAAETWEILMDLAPDEQYSELARLRRDGFDTRDIAIKFRLSVRSIQRKLHRLRAIYLGTVSD